MIDEGYIKFELEWLLGEPPTDDEVRDLRHWRRPLFAAALIGQYTDLGIGYGNISVRSGPGGHFIISGTQTGHLADPGPEHYARVTGYDIEANRVTCVGRVRASSEAMTHAALYELNPAINAVVHVHSARLWRRHLGELPTTDAAVAYGTPAMAREFRRLYRQTAFAEHGIAVMGGHEDGIVGTGHDMAEASRRILALDKPD